ncbi:NACHT domain-containing protein, partial [Streptomyces sp. NPDC058644]|uniref:NACHT domain-containing protein n=1 Tax=unclassified Streptomyces TaxID=2593676 RepID=UPI00364B15DB
MNPHRSRVAAVFGTRQGSGYLLTSRLVLTAAHVVGEADTAEAVVFGGVGETLCDVVWRRKDDVCDAALLVAHADVVPTDVAAGFAPLRWGKLDRLDAQENCQAIGFPLIQRDERGDLDSEQLSGRVKPGSSILGGRYVLESSGTPPQPTADSSPWSGLSGAGLFCRGALIGVVVTAPTGWHNGRVEAVPVRVIADDPEFRHALDRYGGGDVVVETLDALSDREREDHEFEVRYRGYVANRYGLVETLGHGSELGRIVWPLDTAFLALELAETAPRRGPGRSAVEVATGKRVQAALRGRNRILLQGSAGSGKTTLMHWLAVRAAQEDLPSELSQLQGRVPFVVPLRALAGSQGVPQVERLLGDLRYPAADVQPAGWLTRILDRGRGLLLVDGIDEIQHDNRPQVRSWLEGLLSLYPDTAVVVTSRPSAVPGDWLAGYGFTAFSVLPMSPADVGTFIDRWFTALRESEGWGGYWDGEEAYPSALRAAVDAASLTEMAANPRLCTLICALLLERRGYLPHNPLSVHHAALALLLERRDTERSIVLTEGITLNQQQQEHLLDALALWMTLNGESEITLSRASCIVGEASLGVLPGSPAENEEPALRHLLVRSGILHEPEPGTIAFEHSTFRDYFAAHATVDRGHFGFLVNHAHDPQYEDVVRMAVGFCGVSERAHLLRALVERGDREPEHRTRIHLLATAALDYATRLDPEVREEVLRRAEALVPPPDDAAADVLAEAGAVVVRLLQDLEDLTVQETRAAVLTACKVGGPLAAEFLERFQEHPDPAVRERARWGLSRMGSLPRGATDST